MISMPEPQTDLSRPLVVKIGGDAIDQAGPDLWEAVASLHASGNGGGLVVVHGGGAEVDRRLKRAGIETVRHDGIRATPPDAMDEVLCALAGSVNAKVVAALQRCGAPAVGLTLGDGFFAKARVARGLDFDAGRVGEVVGGWPLLAHSLLASGFVPVFSSIGTDEKGEALNINADEAAAAVAMLVGARALVLLTDVAGVLDANGRRIDALHANDIELRIAAGEIVGGMIPKARSAAKAAEQAGAPTLIASWRDAAQVAAAARPWRGGTHVLPPSHEPLRKAVACDAAH